MRLGFEPKRREDHACGSSLAITCEILLQRERVFTKFVLVFFCDVVIGSNSASIWLFIGLKNKSVVLLIEIFFVNSQGRSCELEAEAEELVHDDPNLALPTTFVDLYSSSNNTRSD